MGGNGKVLRDTWEVQRGGFRFVGKHYFHNAISREGVINYGGTE